MRQLDGPGEGRQPPGEVSYKLRQEAQADDGAISGLGSIAEHSNTAVRLAPRPSEVFKRERL